MKRFYLIGITIAIFVVSPIVVAVSCSPSWKYNINVVQFKLTNPQDFPDNHAPGIWIDTHVEISGLRGGTIKSSGPFDVAFDFTDADGIYEGAEFTSITINYDDEVLEKAADKLELPIECRAREHEAINSAKGGEIVKTKLSVISGRIPGVITRDKSFTLELKGHFTKPDGTEVPFEINQHYDVKKEKGTRSWTGVMSGA